MEKMLTANDFDYIQRKTTRPGRYVYKSGSKNSCLSMQNCVSAASKIFALTLAS